MVSTSFYENQAFENFASTCFCKWPLKISILLISAQRKKNKKKTVESMEIQIMILSRSTKRQEGHNEKTVVIDWFQKKA